MFSRYENDTPYQSVGYFVDDVGIVHASPVIRPYRFDVQTRLVLAQRQVIVHPVVGYRLDGRRGALPAFRDHGLCNARSGQTRNDDWCAKRTTALGENVPSAPVLS